MKKLGLLVMPLMAISLLASCGNGGGDAYTVTEQELRDAITFKDVDYLQTNFEKDGIKTYEAFTPTSFHKIDEDVSSQKNYSEYFIIKNDGNAKEYKWDNDGKKFVELTHVEDDFLTISDFAKELEPLKNKDYGDFYYSEKKKEYMTSDCILKDGTKMYFTIQFFNKKIKYFVINYISADVNPVSINYQLAYKKVEPPSPSSFSF